MRAICPPGSGPSEANLSADNAVLPVSDEPLVVLAQLVVSGADYDRLTREAVLATAMNLEADHCELLRLTTDGDAFDRVTAFENGSEREQTRVLGGIASVAGYTLLCGTPVFSEDLARERRFGGTGAPVMDGPVSVVAAPVPGVEDAPGVLVAYAKRAKAFGPCQALSVSRTASLLGGALELLKEYDELRSRLEEAERSGGAERESCSQMPQRKGHGLTGRQLDVLKLLADGLPAKRISLEMGISIHTVHFHQRNLYRTLGAVSATGAIKRSRELGLL